MRGEGLKKNCARGINNKVPCSEKKQRLSTGYLFNSCRLTILDQLPDREDKVFGLVWSQKLMYPIENTKMTVPSNEKLSKSLKDQIQSKAITFSLKCQFLMFKGTGKSSSQRVSFDSKAACILQLGTKGCQE